MGQHSQLSILLHLINDFVQFLVTVLHHIVYLVGDCVQLLPHMIDIILQVPLDHLFSYHLVADKLWVLVGNWLVLLIHSYKIRCLHLWCAILLNLLVLGIHDLNLAIHRFLVHILHLILPLRVQRDEYLLVIQFA